MTSPGQTNNPLRDSTGAVPDQASSTLDLSKLKTPLTIKGRRIFNLGPGVSGELGATRGDAKRLKKFNLPEISTSLGLAAALGIHLKTLAWLSFHSNITDVLHYHYMTRPKRSGGTRTLAAPMPQLKKCQEWIKENILDKLPTSEHAHGFASRRSIVTNARCHLKSAIVINIDLENFFPSINFYRVKGVFKYCGYSPAVATILALLCTDAPKEEFRISSKTTKWIAKGSSTRGLPQGACTSPAISNLVTTRLDKRLAGLAAKLGLTYSRYADDLTFSSRDPNLKLGKRLEFIKTIIEDEGFKINEKKLGIKRRGQRQSVTGLTVNEDVVKAPREYKRELRAILHNAKKSGGLLSQNRLKFESTEGGRDATPLEFCYHILGRINYVEMVEPHLGKKMKADFIAVCPAEILQSLRLKKS